MSASLFSKPLIDAMSPANFTATNPDALKNRTDGELFYIIENGHEDMPPEGHRVKVAENWDLVNYVRSLREEEPVGEQSGTLS